MRGVPSELNPSDKDGIIVETEHDEAKDMTIAIGRLQSGLKKPQAFAEESVCDGPGDVCDDPRVEVAERTGREREERQAFGGGNP